MVDKNELYNLVRGVMVDLPSTDADIDPALVIRDRRASLTDARPDQILLERLWTRRLSHLTANRRQYYMCCEEWCVTPKAGPHFFNFIVRLFTLLTFRCTAPVLTPSRASSSSSSSSVSRKTHTLLHMLIQHYQDPVVCVAADAHR